MNGSEAIKYLRENKRMHWIRGDLSDESLDVIEQELKDYYALKKECEEAKWYQEHKALDIISYKRVQVGDLLYCSCLEEYNKGRDSAYQLTQEEWNLLREVLL